MKLPAKRQESAVDVPAEYAKIFDLSDNMEGVIPRLPQIKIIHQGQMFKMPDESKKEKFEAVILDQNPANAWWAIPITDTGASAVPNCFSMDGKTPAENCSKKQSDYCEGCPQNEFGSDDRGKGKACKNMKRLHLIMEDSMLPRRLTIPPTSIRAIDTYLTQLVDRGLPYRAVETVFTLKKVEGEFEYSEIMCEKGRVLAKEELVEIGKLVMQYKEGARQQEIRADEYKSEEKVQDTSFDPDEFEEPLPDDRNDEEQYAKTPNGETEGKKSNGGFFQRFKKEPESDIPY